MPQILSESQLRRRATKQGFRMTNARARTTSLDNYGGYMLVDLDTNFVVAGVRYDLALNEVAEFLDPQD